MSSKANNRSSPPRGGSRSPHYSKRTTQQTLSAQSTRQPRQPQSESTLTAGLSLHTLQSGKFSCFFSPTIILFCLAIFFLSRSISWLDIVTWCQLAPEQTAVSRFITGFSCRSTRSTTYQRRDDTPPTSRLLWLLMYVSHGYDTRILVRRGK